MKCYGKRLSEILLIVILLTGCAQEHAETPTANAAVSQTKTFFQENRTREH